jgi:UDP-N-acetylglucosamine:LPS N-acetylglucosamine transferase
VDTPTHGHWAIVRHLLLVASTGGHLAQLVALRPWWERHRRTWVTFDKADARSTLSGERIVHAHHPTTRNVPNLLRNAWLAFRVVPRERPDLVVSTGAGVALPFFVMARVMRIPTIYLEVYDRVESRTLTGRLCRPLATAFCVQWPEQRDLYPGSEHVGTTL